MFCVLTGGNKGRPALAGCGWLLLGELGKGGWGSRLRTPAASRAEAGGVGTGGSGRWLGAPDSQAWKADAGLE